MGHHPITNTPANATNAADTPLQRDSNHTTTHHTPTSPELKRHSAAHRAVDSPRSTPAT